MSSVQYFDDTTDQLILRSNSVLCITGDTATVLREELASFFCSKSMEVYYHSESDIYRDMLLIIMNSFLAM